MSAAKKSKKRQTSKRKTPDPGREPREVFAVALGLAKELLDSSALRVDLDVTGNVNLVLDSEKLRAIPKDRFQHGLTPEDFTQLVGTEFDSLINAATHSQPIKELQRRIPSHILKEVGTEEFLWRLQEIVKTLVPATLKERSVLRKTTDGLVLKNISWQVSVKKHDKDRGALSDIPYASVSITYDSPKSVVSPFRFGGEGMLLEFPVFRDSKQLTLELHQADVDKFISTLTDLRNNLEKFKKVQ